MLEMEGATFPARVTGGGVRRPSYDGKAAREGSFLSPPAVSKDLFREYFFQVGLLIPVKL